MKKAKKTLIEVIIIIWVFAIVVTCLGVFFVSNKIAYILGELVGSLTATAVMVHLFRCVDIETELPEKKAVNHARITSVVRTLIELAVLLLSVFIAQWVNPYAVFLGLLARKFSCLLVPFYERITKTKKGE